MDTIFASSTLSDNSIANYTRILKHLNNGQEFTTLGFLRNYSRVLTQLVAAKGGKRASDNTIKNRLTAILSALTHTHQEESEPYNFYYKHFQAMKLKLEKHLISGAKTEREQMNWLTEDELAHIYNEIRRRALQEDASYDDVMNYFLLGLYLELPSARILEYAQMHIVLGTPPKQLPTTSNWLLYNDMCMVINVHKNSNTVGSYDIDLSMYPKFLPILDMYLNTLNKRLSGASKFILFPMLQHRNGSAFSSGDVIRDKLHKIFGKSVGPGMLRKIQDSHQAATLGISKNAIEAMAQQAKAQGHSLETHARNYIKN